MSSTNDQNNNFAEEEKVLQAIQEIPAIFKSFHESFVKGVNEAIANLTEQVPRIVEALRVGFAERFPKEIHPIISSLADRGWFISGEVGFSTLLELKDVLGPENAAFVDKQMSTWISESIPSIEESVLKRFPERIRIISSAIRAHTNKQFELSVPIFLIQAEGICLELLRVKLFSTNYGVPVTKKALDRLDIGDLTRSMLVPLLEGSGITAREVDRHKYPECLNRHEILHGIDTEYANEMNSLKALSLIWYLCTILTKAVPKV